MKTMSATSQRESRHSKSQSGLRSHEGGHSRSSSVSNESNVSGCVKVDAPSVESASANGWNKFSKLLPYMWPDRLYLKIRVITCFILLIGIFLLI